jgi:hypothetical protein
MTTYQGRIEDTFISSLRLQMGLFTSSATLAHSQGMKDKQHWAAIKYRIFLLWPMAAWPLAARANSKGTRACVKHAITIF